MEQIPMDKLARVYLKIRARIQQLTQQYESEVEELKAQQDEIKTALKDQLMALGSKSVRTDQGTVILATKTRYFTQDWDSFKQFVTEHDALDLFERRIHQSNMAKFLEENPSLVPPGLNSDKEYDVSVRKPTK
jgi:phage shock protein A|tara:strand:+ start:864 stop:1262 length:399 start_codon:yes stop_codon:yes gene_type:complete